MIRRRAMPASLLAAVVVAVTVFACEAFVRRAEKAAAFAAEARDPATGAFLERSAAALAARKAHR